MLYLHNRGGFTEHISLFETVKRWRASSASGSWAICSLMMYSWDITEHGFTQR
uniref:Uncharacterized protein n=1 Tax=Arundo donax TaxID=35708 RepID=A0A0A9B5S8_ARUDO